jgi:predicted nucleotidyltransferase
MILKIPTNRPIDFITVSIVSEMKNVVAELGIEVFLVGAAARIILLEHVHNQDIGRATRDIDFAFAVEDWDQFALIKKRLLSNPLSNPQFVEVKNVAHRLRYTHKENNIQFDVDLIPFGGIEDDNNVIAWPPDLNILMNVAGFRDAQTSAIQVELAPNLVISIASIPSIAILKLFAWGDRGQENAKDAIDFLSLLRLYTNAGNQERIYEKATEILEVAGYDIQKAGAWLLGQDAFTLASPETRHKLNTQFTDANQIDRLVTDMAKAIKSKDDAIEYAHTLVELFFKGFTQQSSST